MQVSHVSIGEPVVQSVLSGRFNKTAVYINRLNWKLSFDQIIDRLQKGDSLASIAKDAGVTRQAFQHMYDLRLRKCLPGRLSGRGRQRVFREKHREERSKNEIPSNPEFAKIIEELRSRQSVVSLIRTADHANAKFCETHAVINGQLCSFHCVTRKTKHPRGKREFARTHIRCSRLRKVMFVIFAIRIDGLEAQNFVIPAVDLLADCPEGGNSVAIRVPLKDLEAYNNINPRRDMLSYQDAWHLITERIHSSPR